jgi:hypothetical protein
MDDELQRAESLVHYLQLILDSTLSGGATSAAILHRQDQLEAAIERLEALRKEKAHLIQMGLERWLSSLTVGSETSLLPTVANQVQSRFPP